mgnify:CR=1 FL=1
MAEKPINTARIVGEFARVKEEDLKRRHKTTADRERRIAQLKDNMEQRIMNRKYGKLKQQEPVGIRIPLKKR